MLRRRIIVEVGFDNLGPIDSWCKVIDLENRGSQEITLAFGGPISVRDADHSVRSVESVIRGNELTSNHQSSLMHIIFNLKDTLLIAS